MVVAATANGLRLRLGDPGHAERQRKQERRDDDRDPATWRADGDRGPRDPVEPLEEVVRVAREIPELIAISGQGKRSSRDAIRARSEWVRPAIRGAG